MKIKTKKQLNLPQLIEWAWDNDVTNKCFICNDHNSKSVVFNMMNWAEFSDEFSYNPDDTFTVTTEKEITEDTVIPRIVEIDLCGYDQHEDVFMQENKSINQILNEDEVNKRAFYILNDDLTMTLIWRDGKLIEE